MCEAFKNTWLLFDQDVTSQEENWVLFDQELAIRKSVLNGQVGAQYCPHYPVIASQLQKSL